MAQVWISRLKMIGAGLLAATLAALGLAIILQSAGDRAGAQALCGAAAVCGFAFVADLCVLAVWSGRSSG